MLMPVLVGGVLATDSLGDLVAFQPWDASDPMPLTLFDLPTRTEYEVGGPDVERLTTAGEFSGDDQHLLVLSYVGGEGELRFIDREGSVVSTHVFEQVPDTRVTGMHWTDRGIFVVSVEKGQNRHVQTSRSASPAPAGTVVRKGSAEVVACDDFCRTLRGAGALRLWEPDDAPRRHSGD